jgi:hypothetical protein
VAPGREAFRALGEHTRANLSALAQEWPLLPRLRAHTAGPPGSERLAAVRQASAERFPEVWAELSAFADGAAVPAFTVTGDGLVWTIDHLPVAVPGDGAARHVVGRGLQRSARTLAEAANYLAPSPRVRRD